jgi:CubicO group peptidase (beta-lactamase class C family)
MKRVDILILRLVLLLFAYTSVSQTVDASTASSPNERVIDSMVLADMKEAQAPGAMILVSRDGTSLFEKPYGIRSSKTKEPVTSSTLFLTASVTKTITTTTLLTLCHEKGISTETQVGEILDSLPSEIAALSLHQILSQSSGLLDHKPTRKKWKNDAKAYFSHYGNKLVTKSLEGVFSYTNYGHVLAGMLITEISGSPFEETVHKRIFEPLEMSQSTYSVIDEKWSNHSAAHRGGKAVKHGYTFPMIKSSASLFCSAGDLSRFASCFMNQGQYKGVQVIPKEVIQLMSGLYTPVGVLHNYFGYPGSHYGYGLMSFQFQGRSLIGHPGETTTQNLLFAMSPATKTSFVLMSNAGTYPFIRTFELLAETFLEPGETVLSSEDETEKTLTKERIQAFKGQYFTPDISGDRKSDIEVYIRGNLLYLQLSEDETHSLTWIQDDLFKYDSPQLKFPVEVRFYRDAKGQVEYLNHYWRTSVKIVR